MSIAFIGRARLAGLVVIAGLAAFGANRASADTVDLQSAPVGTFTDLTLGDYKLTWVGYGDQQSVVDVGGLKVLTDSNAANPTGAGITLSRVDGRPFSLLSVDLAARIADTFFRIDVGSSSYGAYFSHPPIPTTLTTFYPSGTTDVTSVDINIVDAFSGYEVTNLVVESPAAVPLPAAGWSGMALLGLGALLRLRKTIGASR